MSDCKKIYLSFENYDVIRTPDNFVFEKGPWHDTTTNRIYNWKFYPESNKEDVDYATTEQLFYWDIKYTEGYAKNEETKQI